MNGTIDTVSKYLPWNTPNIKKNIWEKKGFLKFQNELKIFWKKKTAKNVISKKKSRDFGLLMTLFL